MLALKSLSEIAVTVSLGNDTEPLSPIGILILPNARVARKVLASALKSMWSLCSWMCSLSSPNATVSLPSLPATNMLSRCRPMRAFSTFPVLRSPSKVSFARSIIAKTVSLLSV